MGIGGCFVVGCVNHYSLLQWEAYRNYGVELYERNLLSFPKEGQIWLLVLSEYKDYTDHPIKYY